ncbi:MAG TPA: winged helix DNA-binding domain-containing protein [Ktedonobacteraceae bacterium]|nr:winged helix DNA-binding domain-containing protein [Ktedonobacteraceae bacterium]
MMTLDIARQRLSHQHLMQHTLESPQSLVEWFGAVQAQDFAAAKWALGLRLPALTDDDLEQAFASGAILRTHVMRPTWHLVSPADIGWLLALTAPRVQAAIASYDRHMELDEMTFGRTNTILAAALQGGKQLTRDELAAALEQAGIATANRQRLTQIMMRAELDGVICSGARRGKQFTYALLAERASHTRSFSREEALAELTLRYFRSHGPATVQDCAWWSGLTGFEVRAGLALVASHLLNETIDGQTYWFPQSSHPTQVDAQTAYLLPNYDEYTVGYTDRRAIFDATHAHKLDPRGGLLASTMMLDGQVIGTWKRTFKKNIVVITANSFVPLSDAETHAFAAAANRYGQFLRMSVDASWQAV